MEIEGSAGQRARALNAVHGVIKHREVLALEKLLDRTKVEDLLEKRDVVLNAREYVHLMSVRKRLTAHVSACMMPARVRWFG